MSRRRYRFTVALAATASLVATAVGLAAPANAATGLKLITGNGKTSSCNNYELCLYSNIQYTGQALALPMDGSVTDININIFTPMNDKISSIINRSPNTYCFYSDAGMTGLTFLIHGHEKWPSLPVWMNDQITSWNLGGC